MYCYDSNKQRRIQDFRWGGAAGSGAPLWLLKRRVIYLEDAVTSRKGAFACQKGASSGWKERRICLEERHRWRKGRIFLSEGRIAPAQGRLS